MTLGNYQQRHLRDKLNEHFDLTEFRSLCFDLDVDFDNLAGETKRAKTESLIVHMKERGYIDDLIVAAEKVRPQITWRVGPLTDSPSPYRGLSAFREENAPFFFGREAFTERLIAATTNQRFVAVVGPSGSGKSSVVFAGLLPHLRPAGDWLIADFRPSNQPFRSLATTLIPWLEPNMTETGRLVEIRKLAKMWRERELTLLDVLTRILEKHPDKVRFLLVGDQFEELYALCPKETRHRFVNMLLSMKEEPAVCLVLMLRADFLGQALAFRPMADALQDSDVKLGSLTRAELQRAIEQPATRMGVSFDDGLVKRILGDVETEPGNLPLLQFALTLLWENQVGGRLTHDAYEAIGGVVGALARYAEETYESLGQADQERARHIFVQLVHPGEGTEDTRRLARSSDFTQADWQLVQKLADARLVVTGQETADKETVEVTHEALIRRWQRMIDWINQDREFLLWRQRLRANMAEWKRTNQDEGTLLRGSLLVEAEEWLEQRMERLSEAEQAFIQTSIVRQEEEEGAKQKARQAREKLQKRMILSLTGGLLVALILAVVAGFAWMQVREQNNEILARQLTDQAELLIGEGATGTSQTQAALLLIESLKRYPTERAKSLLAGQLPRFPLLRTQLVHNSPVLTVAVSPDGRIIATGSSDGTITLWEGESGQPQFVVDGEGKIRDSAFTPDGRRLVTGGEGGAALWDTKTGTKISQLARDSIDSVAVRSDGQWVALGGSSGARVLDINTGQEVAIMASSRIYSVDFSPNGRWLATGGDDATARVWNAKTGLEIIDSLPHWSWVYAVEFSPDGQWLATGGEDRTARIWEIGTGRLLDLEDIGDVVRSIAFSPDGDFWAIGTWQNSSVRILPVRQQEEIILVEHSGPVDSLTFSPDGSWVASASHDGKVFIWDTELPALSQELSEPELGAITAITFSPDGRRLATGDEDNTARIWDATSGEELARLPHRDTVNFVSFTSLGTHLISENLYNVWIWDAVTGWVTRRLPKPRSTPIREVALSPDGRWLAVADNADAIFPTLLDGYSAVIQTEAVPGQEIGNDDQIFTGDISGFLGGSNRYSNDLGQKVQISPDGRLLIASFNDIFLESPGRIQVWDTLSGTEVARMEHERAVMAFDVSPKNGLVTSGSRDGDVRIWDLTSGTLQHQFSLSGAIQTTIFSPDGQFVATADDIGAIRIWNVNTGDEIAQMDHGSPVSVALFSPDGHFLAILGGNDVRMWDVGTWDEIHQFQHQSMVLVGAFSPDGHRLATGTEAGTVHVWAIDTEMEITKMTHDLAQPIYEDSTVERIDSRAEKFEGIESMESQELIATICKRITRNLTRVEWEEFLVGQSYQVICSNIALEED